jgi:hypothetical protein
MDGGDMKILYNFLENLKEKDNLRYKSAEEKKYTEITVTGYEGEYSIELPSGTITDVRNEPYYCTQAPITVAERSKACTVFARSDAGIVGSNPIQGMDVWCLCMCVFCVYVKVEALRRADHPPKESYRMSKI